MLNVNVSLTTQTKYIGSQECRMLTVTQHRNPSECGMLNVIHTQNSNILTFNIQIYKILRPLMVRVCVVCGVWCISVCVVSVCVWWRMFHLCHTQKVFMSHFDMSHKKTKGTVKLKVSSSREKPKASRLHWDQWVTRHDQLHRSAHLSIILTTALV